MIADMINNKKRNSIVTDLFIRERNYTFLLLLLHNRILWFQKMLDQILLTSFIMKIPNKRQLL